MTSSTTQGSLRTQASNEFPSTVREATPAGLISSADLLNLASGRFSWSEAWETKILSPFEYLKNGKGSNFRTQLLAAFNKILIVPQDKYERIVDIIDMLQIASLILDDVQDSSRLRRGKPAAHSIFGVPQAINTANYVCFLALEKVKALEQQHSLDLFIEELLNLHRGQGMELHWRETLTCPTEADYITAAQGKTGGLVRLALELMSAQTSIPTSLSLNLISVANLFGIIYQVRNDLQSLQDPDYMKTKGALDDIGEGKFSYPVIHCVRSSPYGMTMLNILRQKSDDSEVRCIAYRCLEQAGSLKYTERFLASLFDITRSRILMSISDTGASESLISLLDNLKS